MVLGSSPVAVTSPSDFVPASSKEFLDIQATIECGFTLKRVRDMTRTYSQTNKKVIGKMKDEFGGVIVDEFVRLKSKIYSMKKIDGKDYNTAKGVNIATELKNFKDVLFSEKIIRHKMNKIRSKKHKLGTYEIDKISLSFFDDKRYVLDDEIDPLA